MKSIDLILYNADIVTIDEKSPNANWIALTDNKILDFGYDKGYEKYKNKSKEAIDLNLFYQTIDVDMVKEKELNRIGGCIFLDGSFGSRNAALKEGYSDDIEY